MDPITPSKRNLEKTIVRVVLCVVIAVTAALVVTPDLAKPLFVKFYRTMYSAQVERPS